MIHVSIPFFPISVNHAYFQRGHTRVLTAKGKKYKAEVKNFLGRHHPEFLAFFKPNVEYELLYLMFFEAGELYCKGWPKDPEMSRHKRIDVTNRVKLLEDALTEAAGYDDKQHWSVSVVKAEALVDEKPYVRVWAWNEEENGPLASFIRSHPS